MWQQNTPFVRKFQYIASFLKGTHSTIAQLYFINSFNDLLHCCNVRSILRNKRFMITRKFSKRYAKNEYIGPERITSPLT
jgi:hypothetical protein